MAELSLRRFFRFVSKYVILLEPFGDFRGYSRTIHIGFADNNPIILANCHDLVQFNDFQLLIGAAFRRKWYRPVQHDTVFRRFPK